MNFQTKLKILALSGILSTAAVGANAQDSDVNGKKIDKTEVKANDTSQTISQDEINTNLIRGALNFKAFVDNGNKNLSLPRKLKLNQTIDAQIKPNMSADDVKAAMGGVVYDDQAKGSGGLIYKDQLKRFNPKEHSDRQLTRPIVPYKGR